MHFGQEAQNVGKVRETDAGPFDDPARVRRSALQEKSPGHPWQRLQIRKPQCAAQSGHAAGIDPYCHPRVVELDFRGLTVRGPPHERVRDGAGIAFGVFGRRAIRIEWKGRGKAFPPRSFHQLVGPVVLDSSFRRQNFGPDDPQRTAPPVSSPRLRLPYVVRSPCWNLLFERSGLSRKSRRTGAPESATRSPGSLPRYSPVRLAPTRSDLNRGRPCLNSQKISSGDPKSLCEYYMG